MRYRARRRGEADEVDADDRALLVHGARRRGQAEWPVRAVGLRGQGSLRSAGDGPARTQLAGLNETSSFRSSPPFTPCSSTVPTPLTWYL